MKDTDSLLIARGHVVDPASGLDQEMDVLLREGRVAAVAAPGKLRGQARRSFNARGCIVAPGFIDLHVHLARAGTGTQGNHRHRNCRGSGRRIYLRLRHAQHRAGERFARDHALDAVCGARRDS